MPARSCFVSVPSAVLTLTLEARRFLCGLFTVALAFVAFLAFLGHLSCPCRVFTSPYHPFPGLGVDFHLVTFVRVRVCCCLEDASAPQVIFCRHAQTIEVSQLMCLQWLRRIRNDACLCSLGLEPGSAPFASSYRLTSSRKPLTFFHVLDPAYPSFSLQVGLNCRPNL